MKITSFSVVMMMALWLIGCDKEGAGGSGASQPSASEANLEQPATATMDAADDNTAVESATPAQGFAAKQAASGGSETKSAGSDTKTPAANGSGTKSAGSDTKTPALNGSGTKDQGSGTK